MGDRKIYDLVPDDDGWALRKRGGERATKRFDTKKEGMEYSVPLVREQDGDSQLVIRKQDGTIQEERTYGSDPHPPKG